MNRIRVGVLVDSLNVRAWQWDVLKAVIALEFVELVLVVKNSALLEKPESLWQKVRRVGLRAPISFYQKVVRTIATRLLYGGHQNRITSFIEKDARVILKELKGVTS